MAGIKIPVQAQLDAGDVQGQLQKLSDAITGLAQNFKTLEGVKINPITPGTFTDVNKLKQDLATISQRSKDFTISQSPDVRRRIRQTGQADKDFFGVDWSRIYLDDKQRAQRVAQDYQKIIKGTSFESQGPVSFPRPAGPQPQQGPTKPTELPTPETKAPGATRASPARPERFGSTPIGQVVNTGLRSAGPVGGVVANSMNAASGAGGIMSGAGAMAGLAGLLGGLVALGVGKIVSGVMGKVGDAEQEGIGYDTLKRQLGDVGVDFDVLRSSVRNAGAAFDIAYNESLKLGQEFTKLSGFTAKNASELGGEVNNAAGFARSFGLDPSAGVNLFAQMRKYQVSEGEGDNRQLALMIGEAVGASGSYSRIEDLMGAMESFVSEQTRQGLAPANASGYLESVAGLTAPKIPGLDLAGATSMLARLNSSIASGGGAGEAGQNFLYQALGQNGRINPAQVQILQQGGAFARPGDMLGKDSVYADFLRANGGGESPLAADETTNLERIISQIKETYKNQPPELMADAFSNLTGLNMSQSMAMLTYKPQDLGRIEKRLSDQGLSLGQVNADSVASLSRIESGDMKTLLQQRDSLLARPDDEYVAKRRDELLATSQKAMSGKSEDVEAFRDLLSAVTAQSGQEKTEGSETRRSIVGVSNAIQNLASQLVPSMNMARDMLILMAGGGKKSGEELLKELRDVELGAAEKRFDAEREALDKSLNDAYLAADNAKRKPFELQNLAGAMLSREADPAEREKIKRETKEKIAKAEQDVLDKERDLAENRAKRADRLKDIDQREARTLGAIEKHHEDQVKARNAERDVTLGVSQGTEVKPVVPSPGASPSPVVGGDPVSPEKISMRGPGGHKRASPELRRKLEEQDRALGLPIGTTEAQFSVESGFDPKAVSSAGAMGIAQIMPANVKSLSERVGRKLDPHNVDDSLLMHRMLMEENLKKFKKPADAMRAYNAGWNRSRWNNEETREYVPKILDRMKTFQAQPMDKPPMKSSEFTPVPETPAPSTATSTAGAQNQYIDIGGTLVLAGMGGQRMGEYTVPKTRVPVPNPSMG